MSNIDATIDKVVELTARQQQYVLLRAQGMTIAAASRGAGFNHDNEGHRLEKRPEVKEALKALQQEAVRETRISRNDVLNGLQDALRAAETATEMVMVWREIAKILGYYEPEKKEIQISAKLDTNMKLIQQMSNEQLAEAIGMDPELVLEGEAVRVEEDDPFGEAEEV